MSTQSFADSVAVLTFGTEQAVPAIPADALERLVAVAVLAARQWYALVAALAVEA